MGYTRGFNTVQHFGQGGKVIDHRYSDDVIALVSYWSDPIFVELYYYLDWSLDCGLWILGWTLARAAIPLAGHENPHTAQSRY